METKIKVTYFQRKPYNWSFSLEYIFEDVRSRLSNEFENKVYICKYFSTGILKRFYNLVEATFHQGDINHITGDVHYLSFLLKK